MKKMITLLLIAASFYVHAQTLDPVLNKRLGEYLTLSKSLQIDKLLTYMYPRIFEMAPKSEIKKALEQAYNNSDIGITLDSLALGNISPLYKFSKGMAAKFDYTVKMKIILLNPEMEDKAESILQNFKKSFGEENVAYDVDNKTFWVYQTKAALAIKDGYSKNVWTMIGLEKDMNISSILPGEVKKKYAL